MAFRFLFPQRTVEKPVTRVASSNRRGDHMFPPLAIKPISGGRMFRFPEQGMQGLEKYRADSDLVQYDAPALILSCIGRLAAGLSLANKGPEANTASVTTPSLLQHISNFIQNHRPHLLGRWSRITVSKLQITVPFTTSQPKSQVSRYVKCLRLP